MGQKNLPFLKAFRSIFGREQHPVEFPKKGRDSAQNFDYAPPFLRGKRRRNFLPV